MPRILVCGSLWDAGTCWIIHSSVTPLLPFNRQAARSSGHRTIQENTFDVVCYGCCCSLWYPLRHVAGTSERSLLSPPCSGTSLDSERSLYHPPGQDGSAQWHGVFPQRSNLHAGMPNGSGAHPPSEWQHHHPQRSALPLKVGCPRSTGSRLVPHKLGAASLHFLIAGEGSRSKEKRPDEAPEVLALWKGATTSRRGWHVYTVPQEDESR